jgi:hypothetical protein
MKLLDYLDELRSRPIESRRRFAFGVTVVFCGLIFGAWLMVVTSRSGTLHYTSSDKDSTTPVGSVVNGFREVTGEIKALGEVLRNLGGSTDIVEQNQDGVSAGTGDVEARE